MNKIDYKMELKYLYKSSAKEAEIVDVPVMNFLLIDGKGDPTKEKSYQQAIEALYSVAYTLKFMAKKGKMALDYGVLPLEGLWWANDMTAFEKNRRNEWLWTMMIMQPDFITTEMVEQAINQAKEKKDPAAIDKLRFEKFNEGKSAQIMHIGPFTEEGPTIEKLHAFIKQNNCELRDKHHEIYLTDIRRAAPQNWKTIIRQPMV